MILTKDKLTEGLEVIIVGAVSPREPWTPETAGQAFEHRSPQLDSRPRGKVQRWAASRFGGVFVEVETTIPHGHTQCDACMKRRQDYRAPACEIGEDEMRQAIVTYALSDLAVEV